MHDSISEDLIARATRGDAAALAEAFEHCRVGLKQAVSMRMDARLCGRVDPSDVVQDTYLDAARRIEEFTAQPDRMPLLLWFRLLALQRLIDLHRRHLGAQIRNASIEISLNQQRSPQASSVWLAEHLIDRQGSGSEAVIRCEVQQTVQAALNHMEPIDREILAMRHFEMLDNSAVAQLLGISITAASNRYVRALRRLKDILVDHHWDD